MAAVGKHRCFHPILEEQLLVGRKRENSLCHLDWRLFRWAGALINHSLGAWDGIFATAVGAEGSLYPLGSGVAWRMGAP